MAMRPTNQLFRRVLFLCVAVIPVNISLPDAAGKVSGTILVKDALTTPGQPATIEARLNTMSLLTAVGMGGESLDFMVNGEVVATAITSGDGRAFVRYSSKTQGVIPIQVRGLRSTRVLPTEGYANLAVWEQRNPIVAIELTALMDLPFAQHSLPDIDMKVVSQRKPMPDAADELAKLTQFYYRVIYIVFLPSSDADAFRVNAEAREWLHAHRFPPGFVLVLPVGEEALGAKIDELHREGWKTVKIGIGRSRMFVNAFLTRRLQAVMVGETSASDAPRKAKVARDWKEVRKKL